MNATFIILLVILVLGITLSICDYFRPNEVAFYASTRARLLREVRNFYLRGKNSSPQWSDEYFQITVLDYLEGKNISQRYRDEVKQMLSVPAYYKFYFEQAFGLTVYKEMMNDFISGVYRDKIYSMEAKLKECLPMELTQNDNAIKMIINAQKAGYLDSEAKPTAKYTKRPHLSTIAVVGDYICSQNGIKNSDKIWGNFWGIKDSTFRKRLSDFDISKIDSEELSKDIRDKLN